MRIVLVIDQLDSLNNGITATARRYADELCMHGHTVTVLGCGTAEKDKMPVAKMRIPFFQRYIEKQGFCFAQPNDEAYCQAFQGADIVHFFLPTWLCRRGEEIARQLKIPSLASFYLQPDTITYSIRLGKVKRASDALYSYFYRSFYHRFRYIHCPSQMIAEQLGLHGYYAQCRVISNGVSNSFKPQTAAPPSNLRGKFTVLMIGRLSAEKRPDLLIEAVRRSKYSDIIQLVFAGSGPKENKYRRLCKRLPNMPIFNLFSEKELLAMINASDLYVNASDAEIEGVSCMEAMACGLVPVISDSKISAARTFAIHPFCLFAAGNAWSLAERIDYWIEHPQERQVIGHRYAYKADQMRARNYIDEMEELYQDVIMDYRSNGYKKAEESSLHRKIHPNSERTNL